MRYSNLCLQTVCFSIFFALASCSSSSSKKSESDDDINVTDSTDSDQSSVINELKLGIHLDLSGPTAALSEPMALAAEAAIAEVSGNANFLNGSTVSAIRADSTCTDNELAATAFEELLSSEVAGVIGSTCSGVTTSVLTNVALPASMLMISPSATSPALSTIEDNGLFFRTAPSDARQAAVLSQSVLDRNIQTVAVSYVNNDYGQGLADEFVRVFEANGGAVTISAAHEDGAADYIDHVNALSAAGGEVLLVAGYIDQAGPEVVGQALDTGAFTRFVFSDGMINESSANLVTAELNGSFGITPGHDGEGSSQFAAVATGFDGSSPYAAESYDAAALILLAMQAANSSDPNLYSLSMFDVANAPGEKIFAGELDKALQLLASGDDIDYVGAARIELVEPGEAMGSFREIEIVDGLITTFGYR